MASRARRNGLPPGLAPVMGAMALLGLGLYLQEIGFFDRGTPTVPEPIATKDPPQNTIGQAPQISRQMDPLAMAILEEMQQAYRARQDVKERWNFRLAYQLDNQPVDVAGSIDIARSVSGPWQVSLNHADQMVRLSFDDREGVAKVIQAATQDFDHQVVRRKFQSKPTLAELFALTQVVNPAQPGLQQSLLGNVPVPLAISPLPLLLEDPIWEIFVQGASKIRLLPAAILDGVAVAAIELESREGKFTFYVDQVTRYFRGLDYPPPPELANKAANITASLRLTQIPADGSVPEPTTSFAEAFLTEPHVKIVRYFVLPFLESATPFVGHPAEGLLFTGLDGNRVDSSYWSGRVAVLVWFADHQNSRLVIQEIEEALRDPNIRDTAWIAVAVDSQVVVPDSNLTRLATDWSISGKVVRDLDAIGRDRLGIHRAPTIVVLDKQGIVQLIEEGGGPELDRELAIVLARCHANEPLAQRYVEMILQGQKAYTEALAAAAEK